MASTAAAAVAASRGAEPEAVSEQDGYSIKELHAAGARCQGFTFDDLIMLPGEIDFSVHDVDLTTKLTRNIALTLPFVSSPMDTVTEANMAREMALQGGIGIIHDKLSVEEQVAMVRDGGLCCRSRFSCLCEGWRCASVRGPVRQARELLPVLPSGSVVYRCLASLPVTASTTRAVCSFHPIDPTRSLACPLPPFPRAQSSATRTGSS